MTWSYSGDPASSDKDMYRFLIGDTNDKDKLLLDTEIQYIIDNHSATNMILYQLYSLLADKFAKDIKKSLGPQSQDPTSRSNYYIGKAAEYKQKVMLTGMSVPTYSYPKAFVKGMHNNV